MRNINIPYQCTRLQIFFSALFSRSTEPIVIKAWHAAFDLYNMCAYCLVVLSFVRKTAWSNMVCPPIMYRWSLAVKARFPPLPPSHSLSLSLFFLSLALCKGERGRLYRAWQQCSVECRLEMRIKKYNTHGNSETVLIMVLVCLKHCWFWAYGCTTILWCLCAERLLLEGLIIRLF